MQDITEIKRMRKNLGLTQNQLAKLSGVSQSLITKIESNKLDPTYSKTQKIFQVLNNINKKENLQIKDIINRKIISVPSSYSLKQTIDLMKKYNISQIPIIDHHPIGLISEKTIIDKLSKYSFEELNKISLKEIMEDCPPILDLNCPFEVITNLLKHYSMILIKEKEKVIGLITKADIINQISKK